MKHGWKITTAILTIICIFLGYSVYDAEMRVERIAGQRDEIQNQLDEYERQEDQSRTTVNTANELYFSTSAGEFYLVKLQDEISAIAKMNGEQPEEEFCTIAALAMALNEEYETANIIYYVNDEYGIIQNEESLEIPKFYQNIDTSSPDLADKFRSASAEILAAIT